MKQVREHAGTHKYFVGYKPHNQVWQRIPDTSGSSPWIYQTITKAPVPTAVPTVAPTIEPTVEPTVAPTSEPTVEPLPNTVTTPDTDPADNTEDPPVQEPIVEPAVDTTEAESATANIDQTDNAADAPDEEPVVEPPPDTTLPALEPIAEDMETPIPDPTSEPPVDTAIPTAEPVGNLANPPVQERTMEPPPVTTVVDSQLPLIEPMDGAVAAPVQQQTMEAPTNTSTSAVIEPVGNVTGSPAQTQPVQSQSTSVSGTPIDISLITRDPNDGHLLTGTCYVLVNYSNEGCDENGDGQVTFAQIPAGTYTVRQTQTPAGYTSINDFAINVAGSFGNPQGFLVRQAPEQNTPGSRNVSFVFVDSQTNQRIVSSICVEMVGASNVGCDQDLRDGQIDFLDVPQGSWPVSFSNVPSGWQVHTDNSSVVIGDASGNTSSHQIFVYSVSIPESGTSGVVESSAGQAVIAPISNTSVAAPTTSSGHATLTMTMRGCPEGFDPNTDDFFTNCTVPLDAPDASFLYHGGDGQGGRNIMWMDRQYNGAYIFNAGPYTMNVSLSGLAPVVRDGYTVIGADSVNGDQVNINLVNGETREVWVFYYFWP